MFAMCPHGMFVLVQTQEEDVRLGAEMWSKASAEIADTFSPHHNALADNLDAKLEIYKSYEELSHILIYIS